MTKEERAANRKYFDWSDKQRQAREEARQEQRRAADEQLCEMYGDDVPSSEELEALFLELGVKFDVHPLTGARLWHLDDASKKLEQRLREREQE